MIDTTANGAPTTAMFTGSYVGGRWILPVEGAGQLVHDPADGIVLVEVADTSVDECLLSVWSARDALASWSATAPRERSEILRRAFTLMQEERETIATLIVRENGKLLDDALGEVDYAAEFFRWFAEEAVRIGGDFRVAPNGDKRIFVTRQPVGWPC